MLSIAPFQEGRGKKGQDFQLQGAEIQSTSFNQKEERGVELVSSVRLGGVRGDCPQGLTECQRAPSVTSDWLFPASGFSPMTGQLVTSSQLSNLPLCGSGEEVGGIRAKMREKGS